MATPKDLFFEELKKVQRLSSQRWRRLLDQEAFQLSPYDRDSLEVFSQLGLFASSTMFALTCLNAWGHQWSRPERLFFELCATVLPWLATWTILVGWTNYVSGFFLLMTLLFWRDTIRDLIKWKREVVRMSEDDYASGRLALMTNFRGMAILVMVLYLSLEQCSCFPEQLRFHPRHYSLGNLGPGLIMLLNGMFEMQRGYKRNRPSKWWRTTWTILLLGLINGYYVIYVKQRYNEQGRHWNFWISVWLARLITALLARPWLRGRNSAFVAGLLLLCLQYWNTRHNMEALLLRPLLRQLPSRFYAELNREGWVGLVGHLALYMCGIGTGRLIRHYDLPHETEAAIELKANGVATFAWWAGSAAFSMWVPRAEAKSELMVVLAGTGYCIWLGSVTLASLALLAAIEAALRYRTRTGGEPFRTLMIYRWINRYPLCFLCCGLLANEFVREYAQDAKKFLVNPYFSLVTVFYGVLAVILVGIIIYSVVDLLFSFMSPPEPKVKNARYYDKRSVQ
ncbi:GPI-anchored wall transfer protein 1-like [Trichogramma pretiosum]|uniref:GPI-anchored wall transfer protein 1-like n=1 Tax=Trichogramma pretiosum TaxID=7493 RepID=UPI0006C94619|nr:GPI-anchored wall transfer protein 1-like [Trichogramma pretiosum]